MSIVSLANNNEEELYARLKQTPYFDFFGKRRKKKMRCEGTVMSMPKKPLTAYAIFVKKVTPRDHLD